MNLFKLTRSKIFLVKSVARAAGFSLIEVLIAVGIMGVGLLAITTLQVNQLRSNNFLELQMKREQLRSFIIGQFLKDPSNCKCMFKDSGQFPQSGVATLPGVDPDSVGLYKFDPASPGDCSTATIPAPIVTKAGIDSVKLSSASLENIQQLNLNKYQGNFVIVIKSIKDVTGPSTISITIPVAINTSAGTSAGNVQFQSCSSEAPVAAKLSASDCTFVSSLQSDTANNQWHSVSCPSNTAIVEVSANATAHLDNALSAICCRIDTKMSIGASTAVQSPTWTGSDYREHKAFCGSNELMTGVQVYASDYFDGPVRAICQKFAGVITTKKIYGSGLREGGLTRWSQDNTKHTARCNNSNEFMSGISFWADDRIDAIAREECSVPIEL